MVTAIFLILSIMVNAGLVAFTAWLFLRPGGLAQRSLEDKDETLKILTNSHTEMQFTVQKIQAEITSLAQVSSDLAASMNSRIASFESKYGKWYKAAEQTALIDRVFDNQKQ